MSFGSRKDTNQKYVICIEIYNRFGELNKNKN